MVLLTARWSIAVPAESCNLRAGGQRQSTLLAIPQQIAVSDSYNWAGPWSRQHRPTQTLAGTAGAFMALTDLQKEAYRAVLRAVAATQLDWVRTDQQHRDSDVPWQNIDHISCDTAMYCSQIHQQSVRVLRVAIRGLSRLCYALMHRAHAAAMLPSCEAVRALGQSCFVQGQAECMGQPIRSQAPLCVRNHAVAVQSKEKLLTDLRKELGISSQEHFMVWEKVMSDKEVEALRENRPPEGQALPEAGMGKKRKDSAPLSGARCATMAGQMRCHMHSASPVPWWMRQMDVLLNGLPVFIVHWKTPPRREALKCRWLLLCPVTIT